jgi:hypothetical protein
LDFAVYRAEGLLVGITVPNGPEYTIQKSGGYPPWPSFRVLTLETSCIETVGGGVIVMNSCAIRYGIATQSSGGSYETQERQRKLESLEKKHDRYLSLVETEDRVTELRRKSRFM